MSGERELIEGVEYEDEHGVLCITNAEPITFHSDCIPVGPKDMLFVTPDGVVPITIRLHKEFPDGIR